MCPETESNRRHGDFQASALDGETRENIDERGSCERLLDQHVAPHILATHQFGGWRYTLFSGGRARVYRTLAEAEQASVAR